MAEKPSPASSAGNTAVNAEEVRALILQLQEATREAHGVLSDLVAERRRANETLGKLTLDAIREHIATHMQNLIPAIKAAQEEAVAKVFEKFDTLFAKLVGAGTPSNPSLEQVASAMGAFGPLKPPATLAAVAALAQAHADEPPAPALIKAGTLPAAGQPPLLKTISARQRAAQVRPSVHKPKKGK